MKVPTMIRYWMENAESQWKNQPEFFRSLLEADDALRQWYADMYIEGVSPVLRMGFEVAYIGLYVACLDANVDVPPLRPEQLATLLPNIKGMYARWPSDAVQADQVAFLEWAEVWTQMMGPTGADAKMGIVLAFNVFLVRG